MLKKDVFTVCNTNLINNKVKRVTVAKAMKEILRQAEAECLRPATIRDYKLYFNHFCEYNKIRYTDQINSSQVYKWLGSLQVSPATKRIRWKALRAVFGRLQKVGMLTDNTYKDIKIKVDEEVKEGTKEEDIQELLSNMDFTDYFQLRDGTAILLMWHTGIRLATLSHLKKEHIDFDNSLLVCTGDIMKNHRRLVLPLPAQLLNMLSVLIEQNHIVGEEFGWESDLIFVTSSGAGFDTGYSGNTFCKKLRLYSKKLNIPNLNAHAIRRGFAKRLLDEGVSVPVISKALGHSSLAVTTRYLHISEAEVINELKRLY